MVNCPKHFADDGSEVTVDVHGCTVDNALYVIRRTVQEACWRGRTRVVVIHGRGRGELMRGLERGDFTEWVTSYTQAAAGGQSTLYMPIGNVREARRIRQQDVVRRHGW